ncbi:divergent polysaccharide deacetylase family protein [Oceanospirillum sediminis]|uniref:Divergent polysaccharide deacetylase family protein n=1 Tax=Oceanospirillum sediminis TaxID=2760088 RepID=A0A839IPT2_9GAMM|nr:divergent polysaccharide deacetylase family protein [Oceanospirillum sediminis]MBB1486684.1 divergent polysaccharide deacetylase family protein [Oceanospirillum sediminis]
MNIPGFRCLKYILVGILSGLFAMQVQAGKQPTITLIIDDLGYNKRNGTRAINLPGPVTLAILPHTPFSKKLARLAYKKGKTVMLHAPMTNIHQRSPGPGTLSPEMDKEAFMASLRKSLDAIPHAQGLNNHMGSELTQDSTRMKWVMEETAKRRLFFIDSRTTAKSVAEKEARSAGVPVLSRDIFLDHIRTEKAVNAAFDVMIKKARRYGNMIAIGHPYSVTMDVLEKRLPELEKMGIRMISVSDQLIAKGQRYQTPDTMVASHSAGNKVSASQQAMTSPAPRLKQSAAMSQTDKGIAVKENRSAAPIKSDPQLVPVAPDAKPSMIKHTPAPVKPVTMDSTKPGLQPLDNQPVKTPAMLQSIPVQHWDLQMKPVP